MIASVVTTLTLPGWHAWPAAPESRGYLRARHRHLFHVRVELEASHADRAIEVHNLRDLVLWGLLSLSDNEPPRLPPLRAVEGVEFGDRSCETIAFQLAHRLRQDYPSPHGLVEILEDNEAGGIIRW